MKKDYIKYGLLVIGAFYLLLPHTIHMKYSPDWVLGFGFPHIVHVTIGATAVILAYLIHTKKVLR